MAVCELDLRGMGRPARLHCAKKQLAVRAGDLGLSERQLVNAVERLVSDGKYELAASLLESTGNRFEQNPSVAGARRLVYRMLMEKNQNFDPFKFIIYSGRIGERTPSMAIEGGGPKGKN